MLTVTKLTVLYNHTGFSTYSIIYNTCLIIVTYLGIYVYVLLCQHYNAFCVTVSDSVSLWGPTL